MSDKIIFLDIDGVLCPYPEWQQDWVGNQNDQFDAVCCKYLRDILDRTGAKIVMTSSWRLFPENANNMWLQFCRFGIPWDTVVGNTPDLQGNRAIKTHLELRWAEIRDYIERFRIEKYIILDDFNLERFDKAHLIRTQRYTGLTAKLRDVCIRKLSD